MLPRKVCFVNAETFVLPFKWHSSHKLGSLSASAECTVTPCQTLCCHSATHWGVVLLHGLEKATQYTCKNSYLEFSEAEVIYQLGDCKANIKPLGRS